MRASKFDGNRAVAQPSERQRKRRRSMLCALGLVATALAGPASVASAATGPITLTPPTAEIAPGGYVDVTVTNSSTKKATSALVSSVSVSSPDFQVTNGCLRVSLGKGKSCVVRIAYTATTAPATDQTARLSVASKKPGVVDAETGTYTVKAPTGCARNAAPGSVASDDLQAVINATDAGGTIQITGTCSGNFTIAKDLTLTGVAGTNPTLDGNRTGRVLDLTGAEDAPIAVTIAGLTIQRGSAPGFTPGGGIRAAFVALSVDDSTITENTASGDTGGGLALTNASTALLNHTTLSNNTAITGGGVHLNCLGVQSLTLNNSSVTGNTRVGINSCGKPVVLNNSNVTGNTATFTAGGIHSNGNPTTLLLKGSSTVTGNTGAFGDGGITWFPAEGVQACNDEGVDTWTGSVSPNTPDQSTTPTPITCS